MMKTKEMTYFEKKIFQQTNQNKPIYEQCPTNAQISHH